ncbi:hypothetical protein I5907_20070 [Panacibacter sp. DH6]|uniref:Histidine kinase domain-containing protein n=1 Tax=Panacibacter microcysteis TaxID=2793269 RepID=A0A931H096_9BACT|nr:two-component regulator propeller domain-containing protein [Panacibacter microcysteis]MBG9378543.1 hypothetical protein [Panacibacter microcysteis]
MRKKVILLFYLVVPVYLFARPISPDEWRLTGEWLTANNGLSQGMINGILEDKEGYMWFATKDGLNRYDGYRIKVFRQDPDDPYSLPDNYITSVSEDGKNNIWVTTLFHGIYIFNKQTERFIKVALPKRKSQAYNLVNIIFRNNYLLLHETDDISLYDISKMEAGDTGYAVEKSIRLAFRYNDIQRNNRYRYSFSERSNSTVSWLPNNNIWVKFTDTLIAVKPSATRAKWMVEGIASTSLLLSKQAFGGAVIEHSPASDSIVYYYANNTLYGYNYKRNNVSLTASFSFTRAQACQKLQSLPDGSVYLFPGKSYIFDPQTASVKKIYVERKNQLFTAMYTSVCVGKHRDMWLGTAGFGVFKTDLQRPAFEIHTTYSNIDAFRLLYPDNWEKTTGFIKKNISLDFINFTRDSEGNYWFTNFLEKKGTEGCLVKYSGDGKPLKKFNLLKGTLYGYAKVFEDRQKRLWVFIDESGRNKKWCRINKQTGAVEQAIYFPVKNIDNGQYSFLFKILQDAEGNFWFATIQGLYKYDVSEGIWVNWRNVPGNTTSLPSDMVFTICADPLQPDSIIWAGTNGAGFCSIDTHTGVCKRYSDKDGLPNNVVYGILADRHGNLWMSTNKGLSCFNIASRMYRNYSGPDNLPGDEFNRNQYFMLPDERMMFGGVDGYVVFDPVQVLQPKPPVPVVFTGLSVSNRVAEWKNDKLLMDGPIEYAGNIILQPGQNTFSISFASLDYRSNDKKFYTYKLEGLADSWTAPATKNEATYTNLSPGTYTFYVRGTNADGVWCTNPRSIKVALLPYWYQTILFKVMVLLIVAASVYTLYRYRLSQQVKLLTIRNRIAGDLHDEIGSTLSSISLSSTIIQQKLGNEQKDVNALLGQISTNTDNMMEAMSDIVWAVNTGNDNMESVVNRMRAFAIETLEPAGIDIDFSVDPSIYKQTIDMVQRKNVYLLFKETINNAVKYAACKKVWVLLDKKDGEIRLCIKDDGKGFALQKNSLPGNGVSLGGNGLPGMHRRAAELRGKLHIQTAPGAGTCITLLFPV